MLDFTPDDLLVTCIARQIQDDDTVTQGLATPLVAAAYLLAKRTHAPHLYLCSAIGQGMCRQPAPLALTKIESLWLDQALTSIGFVQAAVDILPSLAFKEFFRPAQVDRQGNFNNIAFGKDYNQPRLRLPGTGGIPDVTILHNSYYLYVPRHSRLIFVPKLDFCSGLGHALARQADGGPCWLVSDLGQFDFRHGQMRLTTYHPGVTPAQIQARTGFELEIAPDLHETPIPTAEELRLLREEIDPLGIRRLESLNGAARKELLRTILAQEA
jgi:acyl CoA:acetate/3-ketoacid CoA transferase beta subunit